MLTGRTQLIHASSPGVEVFGVGFLEFSGYPILECGHRLLQLSHAMLLAGRSGVTGPLYPFLVEDLRTIPEFSLIIDVISCIT